jgi:hypothetical protein
MADDEKPDGCTLSPDLNFTEMCNLHDMAYAQGGGAVERKKADLELYCGIKQRTNRFTAAVYWIGVRLFGWRHFNWRDKK